MNEIVSQRTMGKTNVSIGTSLALESLIDIHDDIRHNKVPLKEAQELWVNVKTLFRNLWGSIERINHDRVSNEDMARALVYEIEVIKDICKQEGNGVKAIFYSPNYSGLERINSEAMMKLDDTDLQKQLTDRMKKTLDILYRASNGTGSNPENRIRIYDNEMLVADRTDAFILTSYPYDLTNFRKFKSLTLVESHTGKLKRRSMWYTKYTNGKTLTNMPFRLDLLTLLGDNVIFRNRTPAVRKELIRLSVENNWGPITTAAKIRSDCGGIKNHFLKQKILSSISGL